MCCYFYVTLHVYMLLLGHTAIACCYATFMVYVWHTCYATMLLLFYTCWLCIVPAPHRAASGRAYFIRLAKIEISCRLKHRQASWDNNESGIMGSHPALGFPQQTTNQTNMHRSTLSIHVIKIFKLVSLSAIFEDLYWIFAKIFSQQNQLLSSDAQLCYAMLANQATHCTYICICIFSLLCICIWSVYAQLCYAMLTNQATLHFAFHTFYHTCTKYCNKLYIFTFVRYFVLKILLYVVFHIWSTLY